MPVPPRRRPGGPDTLGVHDRSDDRTSPRRSEFTVGPARRLAVRSARGSPAPARRPARRSPARRPRAHLLAAGRRPRSPAPRPRPASSKEPAMAPRGTPRAQALPGAFRRELADFSADARLLALSALALAIGVASAFVAKALVALIQLITNLAYHHALTLRDATPAGGGLGVWAALVPVAGGLAIGLLA